MTANFPARSRSEKLLDSSNPRDRMKDNPITLRDSTDLRRNPLLVRLRGIEDQMHVVTQRCLRRGEANGDLWGTTVGGVQRRDDVDDLQATAFVSRWNEFHTASTAAGRSRPKDFV